MNNIVKTAMRDNRFLKKARNFKEFWSDVDSVFDWNFHKQIQKELGDVKWYEIANKLEVVESYNSYNACSDIVFLMHECIYKGEKLTAFYFHKGGDVRGHYGEAIYTKKSIWEILQDFSEFCLEYSKNGYSWDITPLIGEAGYVFSPYAWNRSDSYNEKLAELSGYYFERFPKGFVTAYESVLF